MMIRKAEVSVRWQVVLLGQEVRDLIALDPLATAAKLVEANDEHLRAALSKTFRHRPSPRLRETIWRQKFGDVSEPEDRCVAQAAMVLILLNERLASLMTGFQADELLLELGNDLLIIRKSADSLATCLDLGQEAETIHARFRWIGTAEAAEVFRGWRDLLVTQPTYLTSIGQEEPPAFVSVVRAVSGFPTQVSLDTNSAAAMLADLEALAVKPPET